MNDHLYSSLSADLPPQMVALSKKDKKWKEKCMDALEQVGRTQYLENLKLIENYEMVKGRFIYNHYFETEGYSDFMAQLTRKFELPSYLRHYDIISQVINTLSGEYQKRPDIFRIKNHSEQADNEFIRTKTNLLIKYVTSQIDAEITAKLLEQNLDPERGGFETEEEAAQYQQMVEQARQSLTPPEIQKYMETDWMESAEIWAQHQLELDKERFQLKEKEKREFEDMLVADRCFRHFYLTADGYNQETWNPVQVFFQKSPDVDYVEDGDYVGRIYYLSVPAIIDRFGYLMTKEELESLQGDTNLNKDKKKWNYTSGSEYVFEKYLVPFEGFKVYDTLVQTQGVPKIDQGVFNNITSGQYFNDRKGLYMVTEAYWKSQKKIGRVYFVDPETGMPTKRLVDENFIVPEHFTQQQSAFRDDQPLDSVSWTWVNEVWKGVKIHLKGSDYHEDIYLNINPIPFQFKGDINPYFAKLPVCGVAGFSVRNSNSMSLVDLMKPYQIFYNVVMNQLYQIAEREIGRWAVWDVNMFPDSKDWGGDKAMEKFMIVAKELGIVPADTSPQNMGQALGPAGGYLPKEFNWDDTPRMMNRAALAEKFEQMALRQVGFNQYRLGAYGAEATAAGVAAGQQTSYAQTESYFTNFSNYLRRCHEMNLSIAQYTQSRNSDVTVMNIKSDMSRSFIKLLGTDLLLADLHVRVINSQEFIRQTEMLRQLAIQNNTSGATLLDLAEIITADSPAEIKIKLKESAKKMEAMQMQQQQLEQQKLESDRELEMLRLQEAERLLDKKLDNNLDVAYVNHGAQILSDDGGGSGDELKGRQLDIQQESESNAASREQQKLDIQKQKLLAEKDYRNKSLAVQQAKINKDLQVQREKLAIVQTMKDKPTK